MKKELDIENWNRKDHFNFFRKFEEPFYGLVVNVGCTAAKQHAKELGISFFLYYLYLSLKAANKIEQFRYRIIDDKVYVYDQINASPTINRENGTFGFAYIDYDPDLELFLEKAKEEIAQVQSTTGLFPAVSGENVIHFSALPWLRFTSLSHARAFSFNDSCPKISFGKVAEENGKLTMPVSIHVHHALIDGFQVGQYVELFQELMNAK